MGSVNRLPSWIQKEKISLKELHKMKSFLRDKNLHTVCESAMCPNREECFKKGTATFLLLGDICTRNCTFCSVTSAKPQPVNMEEPSSIANAVREMNLKYAVLTMVNRDDLKDGGASVVAQTVSQIKTLNPGTLIEVLTGDFKGSEDALETVLKSPLDVFNHNIEMVPSLFRENRPQGNYTRSLSCLKYASTHYRLPVKSGFMVGLGESFEEIESLMKDLKSNGVSILTIGQYLRPSMTNTEVKKYYTPEEFDHLEQLAESAGFRHVFAGPFIRSSYMAESVFTAMTR